MLIRGRAQIPRPRACSRWVEIATSAPRPNWPPSLNLVEALTMTEVILRSATMLTSPVWAARSANIDTAPTTGSSRNDSERRKRRECMRRWSEKTARGAASFLIYRPDRLHNVIPPFAVSAALLVIACEPPTICQLNVISETILEALKRVKYPGFSRDIVSFGLVRAATIAKGTARVSLNLTTSDPKVPAALKAEVERVLRSLPGVKEAVCEVAVAPLPARRTDACGGRPCPAARPGPG